MGIKITDNTGIEQLLNQLKGRSPTNLTKVIKVAMNDALDELVSRAERGQGLRGSFRRYSDSYIRAIRAGRVRSGRSGVRKTKTSPVNLTISGQMLRSLKASAKKITDGWEGLISVSDKSQIGKIKGNDALRPFFGLTKKMKDDLHRKVSKAFAEIL